MSRARVPREAQEDQSYPVCKSLFQDKPSQHLLYKAGRIAQRPRLAGQPNPGSPDGCRFLSYMEVWDATRVSPFSQSTALLSTFQVTGSLRSRSQLFLLPQNAKGVQIE